jgi:hypothetical protein
LIEKDLEITEETFELAWTKDLNEKSHKEFWMFIVDIDDDYAEKFTKDFNDKQFRK